MSIRDDYLKLCLVTNIAKRTVSEYQQFLLAAIRGGITSVQLREKNLSFDALKTLGLALRDVLQPFNIPLIVNDHVDLVTAIDADGVHLGQSDLSPIAARDKIGNKIIGLSIETMEDLEKANQLKCLNYVAASSIFLSKTKNDCKTIWGLSGLQQILKHSIHPVIAIGGIDHNNVSAVMDSGASGIAVVSAIHDHNDPELMTAQLIKQIK